MAIFDLVVVTSTRDATNVYKYKRHGVSKSDIAIGHLGTSGRLARHRLVARPLFSSRGYVADGDGDVRVGRLLHSKSNCPPSSSSARSDGSDGIFGKGIVRLGSSLFCAYGLWSWQAKGVTGWHIWTFLGGRRFGL